MRRSALLAALAVAGCGGGEDSQGGDRALVWADKPRVVESSEVKGARILMGRVRNNSLRRIELLSKDLRMLDAGGGRVKASFGFVGAYVRPDQPRNRPEEELPDVEKRRVGLIVTLEPGDAAPLTASWVDGRPERIDYGKGSLPIAR